MLQRCELF